MCMCLPPSFGIMTIVATIAGFWSYFKASAEVTIMENSKDLLQLNKHIWSTSWFICFEMWLLPFCFGLVSYPSTITLMTVTNIVKNKVINFVVLSVLHGFLYFSHNFSLDARFLHVKVSVQNRMFDSLISVSNCSFFLKLYIFSGMGKLFHGCYFIFLFILFFVFSILLSCRFLFFSHSFSLC